MEKTKFVPVVAHNCRALILYRKFYKCMPMSAHGLPMVRMWWASATPVNGHLCGDLRSDQTSAGMSTSPTSPREPWSMECRNWAICFRNLFKFLQNEHIYFSSTYIIMISVVSLLPIDICSTDVIMFQSIFRMCLSNFANSKCAFYCFSRQQCHHQMLP